MKVIIAIIITIIICCLFYVECPTIIIGTIMAATIVSYNKELYKVTRGGKGNTKRNAKSIKIWHGPDSTHYNVANYPKYENLIKKILRNYNIIYDGDIYSSFYKIYKHGSSNKQKKWGNASNTKSTKTYKFSDKILNKIKAPPGSIYMDFGCGDGRLAKEISELIPEVQTYCIDAEDFRENKESKFILNDEPKILNDSFEDGSVSVITASQVLHHVNFKNNGVLEKFDDRLLFTLKLMVAKLKPGGLLIIREHDVYSLDRLYPVILEHLMFALMEIEDKDLTPTELKNWIDTYHMINDGWYFSKQYIISLIKGLGLKQLFYENKAGNNPSHIFNVLFQKKF
jgi:SAM-dependent methyltransferase